MLFSPSEQEDASQQADLEDMEMALMAFDQLTEVAQEGREEITEEELVYEWDEVLEETDADFA
jgi:hypothetical protein